MIDMLELYRIVFAHVHITDPRDDADDACMACGLDLRDPVHSDKFLELRRIRDDNLREQGRARLKSYSDLWG